MAAQQGYEQLIATFRADDGVDEITEVAADDTLREAVESERQGEQQTRDQDQALDILTQESAILCKDDRITVPQSEYQNATLSLVTEVPSQGQSESSPSRSNELHELTNSREEHYDIVNSDASTAALESDHYPPEILENLRPMWKKGQCTLCDPPVILGGEGKSKKYRVFCRHFSSVHKMNTVRCLMCPMEFKTRDGCLAKHYKFEHFKGTFKCKAVGCKAIKSKRISFFAQDYFKHAVTYHTCEGT